MEALGVQHSEQGGIAGLLMRADSPVGGASSTRASACGIRTEPPVRRRPPLSMAARHLQALAQLNEAAFAAMDALAVADYVEAADYAAEIEELSRTVEYLQVLAAGAVDRTRTQAIAAAGARTTNATASWVTGWDAGEGSPAALVPRSPADDGCRNTAEFLRVRLRIGISEARRRLSLAHDALPSITLSGETVPPAREHLARGLRPACRFIMEGAAGTPAADLSSSTVAAPVVSSRAGTIISLTLDRLQHSTTVETLARIECDLTRTAGTADTDFLARVARRWSDAIDADGTEPSEEALRHTQGAFIRKPRHGLHHLEIFATTDQYEHLLTVMNTATNPRTGARENAGGKGGTAAQEICQDVGSDLDRRTRSQKQLDGIITAVKAALTTNALPTAGGNRPQILAIINYQDLFTRPGAGTGRDAGRATAGSASGSGLGGGTGNFTFTGPIPAATVRKVACDADIIPALLGTSGEILDLGRKTRLFTAAQRLALTARDQGCSFPNCTIPAPWCEAHHITYWSQDGPSNASNGALLCSHHHHLIHKEQWTITTRNGVPWFTPPRHIDPAQKPQQNHYFKTWGQEPPAWAGMAAGIRTKKNTPVRRPGCNR